ncbi:MAG TPA: Spy/CpxP family protein refolding chaperone [Pyrinomonadaceae bacterium]|jgi:Spy/CpxP family protein refolding chaperone|nr:Spy/CpxP family protein refolding chaperone [Pyrinomonadaceae bacterium]
MRKRIAVVAAAVVLCAAAAVAAQEWHAGGGAHPPPHFGVPDAAHVEHLTRVLGLSDAQATEIKTFFDGERAAVEAIHQRLRATHEQLEAATANGRFDEAQVRAIAAQQGQAHADMVVEHERCKAKVYSVLTAEQRAKLEELHRQHGPFKRRGPGDPPPPGQE